MLNKLKKLLSSEESDAVYVNYNSETIDGYRQQFPDIEISEVKLPELDQVNWFLIKKWFKKDGDKISKNERICLIESSSLTIELESYVDGYIYFRQKPKQQLKTGHTICVILQKKID